MKNIRRRQMIGLFLLFLIAFLWYGTPFQHLLRTPSALRLQTGQSTALNLEIPVNARVTTSNCQVAEINGIRQSCLDFNLQQPIRIVPVQPGQADVRIHLFGLIPVKSVHVQVVPHLSVIPGGQSIGIKLLSHGIMVVGFNEVKSGMESLSPAEKAGMKVGDVIMEMDGVAIQTTEQAARMIEQAGKEGRSILIQVLRNRHPIKLYVKPIRETETKSYRIGLYIRDRAAGVGTLTFYDPVRHVFGALGHVITDVDTGQPISVRDGQIIHSRVTSIDKGESGQPGEKRGIFVDEERVLGSITKNCEFGVFGKMTRMPENAMIHQALPVALAEQVKEGPAQILTVVEGQKVEAFDIQIVHVLKQKYPSIKSMVIKVTDPRLLAKTGGIVQGMSGSPIIQNGKVVGAVTHVFVNDPTQGYGVFIEWMLQEAGIPMSSQENASVA